MGNHRPPFADSVASGQGAAREVPAKAKFDFTSMVPLLDLLDVTRRLAALVPESDAPARDELMTCAKALVREMSHGLTAGGLPIGTDHE